MAGIGDRGPGSLLRFVARFNGWSVCVIECTKAVESTNPDDEAAPIRVTVPDPGNQLYKMGFFGKGTLSRSQPMYNRNVNSKRKRRNFNDKPNKRMRSFHVKHVAAQSPSTSSTSSTSLPSTAISDDRKPSETPVESEEKVGETEEGTPPEVVEEFLQLGYEEAFYLAFETNLLDIIDEKDYFMSAEECWERFSITDPSFPFRFVVYNFYRRKGWVVRSGLKYGTDFVLYPSSGPTRHHAVSSILITPQFGNRNSIDHRRMTNWETLHTLGRVSETVAKGLVNCYVVVHEGEETTDNTELRKYTSFHSWFPFPLLPSESDSTATALSDSTTTTTTPDNPPMLQKYSEGYSIVEIPIVRVTPDKLLTACLSGNTKEKKQPKSKAKK